MYHLANIDSVSEDYRMGKLADDDREYLMKYKYVNIMLDEVEMYFHPDLQRRFLHYVRTAIKNLQFEAIKGINVLVVTHSPFVISDLPRKNILFLGDGEESSETFCANIHDMLNQSFFMDYSVGEIARKEIQHIISLHELLRTGGNMVALKEDLEKNKDKYDYISKTIADEYLRKSVKTMLIELYSKLLGRKAALEEEIKLAKERLTALEEERNRYD